jgi:hypothetical protein
MVQYEHIAARLQSLGETLQGLVQQLPAVLRDSADGLLHTLPGEIAA